jgi:hypothetical protein
MNLAEKRPEFDGRTGCDRFNLLKRPHNLEFHSPILFENRRQRKAS